LNLVANSVVLSVAVDITEVLRQLAAEGWEIDPEDFAVLSPYRREVIRRFADYATEGPHVRPAPFDPTSAWSPCRRRPDPESLGSRAATDSRPGGA
jgi:hypothetical protein